MTIPIGTKLEILTDYPNGAPFIKGHVVTVLKSGTHSIVAETKIGTEGRLLMSGEGMNWERLSEAIKKTEEQVSLEERIEKLEERVFAPTRDVDVRFVYEYCSADTTEHMNRLVREGWELVAASRILYGDTLWTVLMRKESKCV